MARTNYLKNVLKSIAFTAADTVMSFVPHTKEFAEQNSEFIKQTFSSIRLPKMGVRRIVKAFTSSKLFEPIAYTWDNLKQDLKTGDFYAAARKEAADAKLMGMDFGDFDSDFNFDEDDFGDAIDTIDDEPTPEDTITTGDKQIMDSIEGSTQAAAQTQVQAILSATDISMKNTRIATSTLYEQNERIFSSMHTDVVNIGGVLRTMFDMESKVLGNIDQNLSKFQTEELKQSTERTEILKQWFEWEKKEAETAREKEEAALSKRRERAPKTASDIAYGGIPNLTDYWETIQKQFKDSLSMFYITEDSTILDALKVEYGTAPIRAALQGALTALSPKPLKEGMKKLDEAVANIFPNFIRAMNRRANTFSSSMGFMDIGAMIAGWFGLDTKLTTSIDTGKYEKGKVPWDGIARKALVTVIPGYLARIEAHLSGEKQMTFDYESGKFKSMERTKKESKERLQSAANFAFMNADDEISKRMGTIKSDVVEEIKQQLIAEANSEHGVEVEYVNEYGNLAKKKLVKPKATGTDGKVTIQDIEKDEEFKRELDRRIALELKKYDDAMSQFKVWMFKAVNNNEDFNLTDTQSEREKAAEAATAGTTDKTQDEAKSEGEKKPEEKSRKRYDLTEDEKDDVRKDLLREIHRSSTGSYEIVNAEGEKIKKRSGITITLPKLKDDKGNDTDKDDTSLFYLDESYDGKKTNYKQKRIDLIEQNEELKRELERRYKAKQDEIRHRDATDHGVKQEDYPELFERFETIRRLMSKLPPEVITSLTRELYDSGSSYNSSQLNDTYQAAGPQIDIHSYEKNDVDWVHGSRAGGLLGRPDSYGLTVYDYLRNINAELTYINQYGVVTMPKVPLTISPAPQPEEPSAPKGRKGKPKKKNAKDATPEGQRSPKNKAEDAAVLPEEEQPKTHKERIKDIQLSMKTAEQIKADRKAKQKTYWRQSVESDPKTKLLKTLLERGSTLSDIRDIEGIYSSWDDNNEDAKALREYLVKLYTLKRKSIFNPNTGEEAIIDELKDQLDITSAEAKDKVKPLINILNRLQPKGQAATNEAQMLALIKRANEMDEGKSKDQKVRIQDLEDTEETKGFVDKLISRLGLDKFKKWLTDISSGLSNTVIKIADKTNKWIYDVFFEKHYKDPQTKEEYSGFLDFLFHKTTTSLGKLKDLMKENIVDPLKKVFGVGDDFSDRFKGSLKGMAGRIWDVFTGANRRVWGEPLTDWMLSHGFTRSILTNLMPGEITKAIARSNEAELSRFTDEELEAYAKEREETIKEEDGEEKWLRRTGMHLGGIVSWKVRELVKHGEDKERLSLIIEGMDEGDALEYLNAELLEKEMGRINKELEKRKLLKTEEAKSEGKAKPEEKDEKTNAEEAATGGTSQAKPDDKSKEQPTPTPKPTEEQQKLQPAPQEPPAQPKPQEEAEKAATGGEQAPKQEIHFANESNWTSTVITLDAAREIISELDKGTSIAELANKYKVSKSTIRNIKNGKGPFKRADTGQGKAKGTINIDDFIPPPIEDENKTIDTTDEDAVQYADGTPTGKPFVGGSMLTRGETAITKYGMGIVPKTGYYWADTPTHILNNRDTAHAFAGTGIKNIRDISVEQASAEESREEKKLFGTHAKGTTDLSKLSMDALFEGTTMEKPKIGQLTQDKPSEKTNVDQESVSSKIVDDYKGILQQMQSELKGSPKDAQISQIKKNEKNKIEDSTTAISSHAEGTTDEKNAWITGAQAVMEDAKLTGNQIKAKAEEMWKNAQKKNKGFAAIVEGVKHNAPELLAGGLVGSGVSLLFGLVGGPLLGAAVGAGSTLIAKSEKLQNMLFGKIGQDGERQNNGLISKSIQDTFKKYVPDMFDYSMAGILGSLFLPFGPIGGILIGSSIGYLKNNDEMRHTLFGKLGLGALDKDSKSIIKQFVPNAIKGGILGGVATLFGGPFGLVGNMVVGSGIGMMLATDEFKNQLLGTLTRHGRIGGVVGAIKDAFEPLKQIALDFKDRVFKTIDKNIFNPMMRFIGPAIRAIPQVAAILPRKLNEWFEKRFAVGIDTLVGKWVIDPVKKLMSPMAKIGAKIFSGITSPLQLFGWAGDKIRKKQMETMNASYMTADERLQFASDHNLEMDQSLDHFLASIGSKNFTIEQAKELQSKLETINTNQREMLSQKYKANDVIVKKLKSFRSADGKAIPSSVIIEIKKAIQDGRPQSLEKIPTILAAHGLEGRGFTQPEMDLFFNDEEVGLKKDIADYQDADRRWRKSKDVSEEQRAQARSEVGKIFSDQGINNIDFTDSHELNKLIAYLETDIKRAEREKDEGVERESLLVQKDIKGILQNIYNAVSGVEGLKTDGTPELAARKEQDKAALESGAITSNITIGQTKVDAISKYGPGIKDVPEAIRPQFEAGKPSTTAKLAYDLINDPSIKIDSKVGETLYTRTESELRDLQAILQNTDFKVYFKETGRTLTQEDIDFLAKRTRYDASVLANRIRRVADAHAFKDYPTIQSINDNGVAIAGLQRKDVKLAEGFITPVSGALKTKEQIEQEKQHAKETKESIARSKKANEETDQAVNQAEANKGKNLGGSEAAANTVADELGAAAGTIRLPHLAKGTAKSRAIDIKSIIDTTIPDKPLGVDNKALKVIPKNIESASATKKPMFEPATETIREGKIPEVKDLPEVKKQDKSKIECEADKITETKSLVPHHAKGSHTIRSDIIDNKLTLGGMALGRALFGYLTFGPWGAILSPAIQFGTDLLLRSQSLREALFGKLVNGKRDDSGLISAGIVDAVQKHFPTIAKSGMLGMVSSMALPFGPVAGLFLGGGLGFLKSNEEFRNKLLGSLGIDAKKRKWLAEHAIAGKRGAALGAISTLFGGPFGLLGNAAVGAGLGMLASSDTFKDALLGKKDKFGVRHGGVIGGFKEAFHDAIVTPLKQIWHPLKRSIVDLATWIPRHFMKRFGDNVRGGFRYAFGAFGEGLKGIAKSLADILPKGLKDALGGFTKSLSGWLKEKIFGDVTMKDIGKTIFNTVAGGGLGGLAGWMFGFNPILGAMIGESATALPGLLAKAGNAATRQQSKSFNTWGQTAGEIAQIQKGDESTAKTYQMLADIEANKAGNKKEAAKNVLKYQEERAKLLDTKRKEKIAEDLQMRKTLEEAGLSDLAIYQLIRQRINKGQDLTMEDLHGRVENGVTYDSAISANLRDLKGTLSEEQYKILEDTLTQAVNKGAQRRRELDAIKQGTSASMQELQKQYGADLKSLGLTDEQMLDEEVMKNLAKITESSLALSDKNLTIEEEALEIAKKQEGHLKSIEDFTQVMEDTGITAHLDEEALMRVWEKLDLDGKRRMKEMVKQGEAELGTTSNASESIFDVLTDTEPKATKVYTSNAEKVADAVAAETGDFAKGTIKLPHHAAKGSIKPESLVTASALTEPKRPLQHHFLGSLISGLGGGLWDFATGLFKPTGKIQKSKLIEQKEAQAGVPPTDAGAAPVAQPNGGGTTSLANSDIDKAGDNKTTYMTEHGPVTLVDNGDGPKPDTDDTTKETLNKKSRADRIREKINKATLMASSAIGKAFGTGSDADQKKGKGLGWLGSLLLGGALWKAGILSKVWDGIKPWLLGTAIPKVGELIGEGATMAVAGITKALPGILEGTVSMLVSLLPSVLKGAWEGGKGIISGVVAGVENLFTGGNKREVETHQSLTVDSTGGERDTGTQSGYVDKAGKPLTYNEVIAMAKNVKDGEYIEAYTSGGYQLKREGTDSKGNPEVNHDMAGYTGERLLHSAANNAKNILTHGTYGAWMASKAAAGFTNLGNLAARAGKNKILLKAITKPVEWGSKLMAKVANPINTAKGLTGWLMSIMEKIFNNGAMKWILNKMPFVNNLGDKLAAKVTEFVTKMSEKAVAKAGTSKVASAIARYAPLLGQILFMSDLASGYNEAEYIMNVANPTTAQCVTAAFARAFCNLSVVFAIWPGEAQTAQWFYKNVFASEKELAKYEQEVAETQAEYEAYKSAGGDLEKDDWLSRKSTWGSFKGWWVDLFRGDWNKGPDIASKVAQFRWKFTAHIKGDKDFLATFKMYTDVENAKLLLQQALGDNPMAAEIYIRLCVIFKADIVTSKPLTPQDYDEMYKVYQTKVLNKAEGRDLEDLKQAGTDMADSLAKSQLFDQNADGTTTKNGETQLSERDKTDDANSISGASKTLSHRQRAEQAYGSDSARVAAGTQKDYATKMQEKQPDDMEKYYRDALTGDNLLRTSGEATPEDLQFFKFLYDAQKLGVLDKKISLDFLMAHVDTLFSQLDEGLKDAIKIRLYNIYHQNADDITTNLTDADENKDRLREVGWSEDPKKILTPQKSTKSSSKLMYNEGEDLRPSHIKGTINLSPAMTGVDYSHIPDPARKPDTMYSPSSYMPIVNSNKNLTASYMRGDATTQALAGPHKPTTPIKTKAAFEPGIFTGEVNGIPVQTIYAKSLEEAEKIANTDTYPPLTAIITPKDKLGPTTNAVSIATENITDFDTKLALMDNLENPDFIKSRAKTKVQQSEPASVVKQSIESPIATKPVEKPAPAAVVPEPKPVEQPKPSTIEKVSKVVDATPKPAQVVSTPKPSLVPDKAVTNSNVKVYTGKTKGIEYQGVEAPTIAEAEKIANTDAYPPLTELVTTNRSHRRGPSRDAKLKAVEHITDQTKRLFKLRLFDAPLYIFNEAKSATMRRTGKRTARGLLGRGTIDEEYAKLSPEITSYASMAVDMIPETALDHIKNASLKSLIITAAGALVGFIDKLFTSSFLINSLKSVVQWLGNTNAAHSIAALCTNIKNILIPAFQAKLAKLTETQIMQMVARIQPITKIAFAVWDALDGIDRAEAIVGVVNPSPLDHIIAAICQFLLGQFAGGMLYYVLGTEFTVQMIYKAASMVFNMDEYKKKYIETERLYQAFKSQPGNENITKTKWLTMEYSYWGSLLKFFSDPDLQAFERLLNAKVSANTTYKRGMNKKKPTSRAEMLRQARRGKTPTIKSSPITNIMNTAQSSFANELNMMMGIPIEPAKKPPITEPTTTTEPIIPAQPKIAEIAKTVASVPQIDSTPATTKPATPPSGGTGRQYDLSTKPIKKPQKKPKINLVPSKFGKGFAKQIDPAVADLPYNIDGDSTTQTYYDSACGPVTAVNMLESITGKSLGSEAVIEAGTAALTGGYKELDGGTDPRFHQDYLKQHGIDTELVSTKQKIADNIEKGPTTLMIEEPTTKNRHYIETEGVTPDGLVSVNDPENPQDGVLYDKQDIVNQSLVGITAKGTGKKKKPQFGRGWNYTPKESDIRQAVMIRNVLKQKGYSDNAIYGILANMEVESGWHFNPKRVEQQLINEIKASGKTFGMAKITDDEYTKAVDTGAISKQEFIYPSVGSDAGKPRRGYGLVQFTSADKKGLLYDATVGQGKSIGDLGLQVEAFDSYIQKYVKGLYSSLHDPNITPTAAAEAMLAKYEIPAKSVWDKTSKERRESSIKWQQILSGNSDATMPGEAASASAPADLNHQSYNNESSTSTENKGPISTTTGSSGVSAILDAIKSAFTSELNKMLGIPETAPASETSGGNTSSTTSSTEGGTTGGATPGNVPTGPMTGGDPDKMVAIARQELGTLESPPGSNKVKYNDWIYGKKGAVAQWCANFISWVANQAGIDKSILPHVGYTPDYFDKVLKGGGKEVTTKEAMKGDLMFFAGRAGRPYGVYHIGLVTGADGKGKVSTIEGNTSTKGSKDGIAVAEKVRQSTANLPLRILRPNYKDPGTPSGQQTQNTQLGEAEAASYAGTRGGGVMSSFTPKGILGRGMPYTDKVQKIKNIDGTTENIEVSGSDDELTKRLKLGEEKAKRDEIIKKAHGKTDEPETPEYGMGSGGFLDSFKDVLGGFTNNLSSIFVMPTPQAGQIPGIVQIPMKAQETTVTPASTKPSILEKASKLASTKTTPVTTPTQTQPQTPSKTGEAPIKTSTVMAEQAKMIPLAQVMPAQPTDQSGSFLGNILSSFTSGEISNPFSGFLDSLSEFNPKDLLGSFIPSMESGGNFLNGLLSSFGIPVPQASVMAGQTPGIVQGQPIVQPNSNQKPIPTEAAPKSVADVAKTITTTQAVPPKATEVAQKPSEVVATPPAPVKPTVTTQQSQTPPKSVADIAKAITSDKTTQTKATSVTTSTQTQPQTPSKTGEAQPTTLPQAQPTPVQPAASEKPIEAQKPQITQAMNILQPSTQSSISSSPLSGLLSGLMSGNTSSLPSFGDMAGSMLHGILGSQSQSQQPIMGSLTQEGFTRQVIELLTDISHHTDNLGLMLQIMQQQTGIKITPTQVANAQKGNSLSDRLAERLKPTIGSKDNQSKPSVRPSPKVQSTDGLSKLQAYADGTENNNIAMIKNLMESLASS